MNFKNRRKEQGIKKKENKNPKNLLIVIFSNFNQVINRNDEASQN
jgi:hypothetical protein